MKKIIYYATGNAGKFAEAAEFFASFPLIELRQLSCDFDEIQCDNQDAIALDKARQAYAMVQSPVLLDDAGIYFEKYHNFPGTISKQVMQGVGFKGLFKLVDHGDAACFKLTLAYYEGPTDYKLFHGICSGTVNIPTDISIADKNLPYDILFVAENTGKTYLQLRDEGMLPEYNYRTRALRDFMTWYANAHDCRV